MSDRIEKRWPCYRTAKIIPLSYKVKSSSKNSRNGGPISEFPMDGREMCRWLPLFGSPILTTLTIICSNYLIQSFLVKNPPFDSNRIKCIPETCFGTVNEAFALPEIFRFAKSCPFKPIRLIMPVCALAKRMVTSSPRRAGFGDMSKRAPASCSTPNTNVGATSA